MAAPALTLLDPAHYRRTPWKNGGGFTIDIAGAYRPGAAPGDWDGMRWRFGRTRIERPGPFSDLAGFDRILAVIEGEGLVLHPRGRPPLDVRTPFRPVRFAGEWAIEIELTAGPVAVLNLIADRKHYTIDLAFHGAGPDTILSPGHVIAYAPGGATLAVEDREVALAPDAALAFDTDRAVRLRVVHGRVAIASLGDRAWRGVRNGPALVPLARE